MNDIGRTIAELQGGAADEVELAPTWVPDKEVKECQVLSVILSALFSLLRLPPLRLLFVSDS